MIYWGKWLYNKNRNRKSSMFIPSFQTVWWQGLASSMRYASLALRRDVLRVGCNSSGISPLSAIEWPGWLKANASFFYYCYTCRNIYLYKMDVLVVIDKLDWKKKERRSSYLNFGLDNELRSKLANHKTRHYFDIKWKGMKRLKEEVFMTVSLIF